MSKELTITIPEALKLHVGLKRSKLQSLCILGKLKAQKVGCDWHILISDLDGLFLGR